MSHRHTPGTRPAQGAAVPQNDTARWRLLPLALAAALYGQQASAQDLEGLQPQPVPLPVEATATPPRGQTSAGSESAAASATAGAAPEAGTEPLDTIAVSQATPPPVPPEPESSNRLLDEIIVTAQKREENVLDVPISIQAFSADALDARGISEPGGLQLATPGLDVGEQAQFTTIFLRGVGSDAFLMADPSVAYYVDGIYFPFSQGQSQDFGAVERVEVLKGPQGTLFGRNAVGGAISVLTRDPSFKNNDTELEAGYGNRDTFDTRVYQNLALSDSLALNLSGFYTRGDHYMSGTANGEPIPQEQSKGARLKLRWAPLDELDIVLAGLRLEQRGTGSVFTLNQEPTQAFSCTPIATPLCIAPQRGYKGALSEPTFLRFKNTVGYGQATYKTPAFDIKLLGSDQRARAAFTYDFDGSPQALAAFDQKRNFADVQTTELQLLSNDSTWGHERLSWIVGGYYFKSVQGFDTANLQLAGVDLGDQKPGGLSLPQGLLDLLDQINLQVPNGDIAFHAIIGTLSKAGFIQATLKFTDWLSLTAGARYQDEQRYLINSDSGLYLSDGGFQQLFNWNQIGARNADGSFKDIHDTTTSFKPKATLELRPFDDQTLFYLSYQEALKSATYNAVAIYQPPAFVKPEELQAWEVGAKTVLFDGSTALSVAAFDYDIRNFQVQFISLFQGGAVSFENADAASIRGVDFDLTTGLFPSVFDDLTLTLGGAYLDSRYDKYVSASGFDPDSGAFSSDNDYTGNRIVRTPKYSASASLNKLWHVPGGDLELGGDAYYNNGFYYASSNAKNLDQPSYAVFGGRVSYLYERWGLRATLYGRNLGDKKYSQGQIATDFGSNVTLAPPLTYGLRLNWQF